MHKARDEPAEAEKLLLAIGRFGWPEARDWAEQQGWDEPKLFLLLAYLERQGWVEIETVTDHGSHG